MKIHTESIVLDTSKSKVFEYLTDYENISKWSVNFIKQLDKTTNGYIATTPVGKISFELNSDQRTGVVDMILGGQTIPTRVVSIGQNTLYQFTLIFPPDLPQEEFRKGIEGLKEELALFKQQLEH